MNGGASVRGSERVGPDGDDRLHRAVEAALEDHPDCGEPQQIGVGEHGDTCGHDHEERGEGGDDLVASDSTPGHGEHPRTEDESNGDEDANDERGVGVVREADVIEALDVEPVDGFFGQPTDHDDEREDAERWLGGDDAEAGAHHVDELAPPLPFGSGEVLLAHDDDEQQAPCHRGDADRDECGRQAGERGEPAERADANDGRDVLPLTAAQDECLDLFG